MSSSLIVGMSCTSIENTVTLSNHAINKGCANTLVLPPFFFRPADDDGIVDFYEQFVRRLRTNAQNIVLYHFPETACVELSVDAIQRLVTTFLNEFAGLKDNSGDLISTLTFINACPDLAITLATTTCFGRYWNMAGIHPSRLQQICSPTFSGILKKGGHHLRSAQGQCWKRS
ncbi:dihydrodipicolinate synthase family protein [Epibacterium ulvae]|uniref:dihydrodipicolinate synthase family protein n=1 Tax=Epibacterium ulvae TaxID=1156985 RepID=UPI002491256B|nr:dihydrodipicolinate synthase family protein [Epibacterium ulvae]